MEQREPYFLPRIPEADFPALDAMLGHEEDFPPAYSMWLALWERRRLEEEQHGYQVVFVDIDVPTFKLFCEAYKLPPSWGALTKYVEQLATRS